MRKILLFLTAIVAFLLVEPLSVKADSRSECGPKYAVRYHDHDLFRELRKYTCWIGPLDRKQIISLKPNADIKTMPKKFRDVLKPFHEGMLTGYIPRVQGGNADPEITRLTNQITAQSFEATLKQVLSFGIRRTDAEKKKFTDWAHKYLADLGYQVVTDYNVVAVKKGTTDGMVIAIGHFDTVPSTVGADDNASGASGVLELARALANVNTQKSIILILSNDEEKGLLGAKRFVKELSDKGQKAKVQFVVNMDMIAFNKNGIVDLETEPPFKDLAAWMAEQTAAYTTLTPKIVLNAWGSDHVPFIDAGIPALLTIENWDTHTPCWHQTCDKIDTVNVEFAAQILKLNTAALALKAGLIQ